MKKNHFLLSVLLLTFLVACEYNNPTPPTDDNICPLSISESSNASIENSLSDASFKVIKKLEYNSSLVGGLKVGLEKVELGYRVYSLPRDSGEEDDFNFKEILIDERSNLFSRIEEVFNDSLLVYNTDSGSCSLAGVWIHMRVWARETNEMIEGDSISFRNLPLVKFNLLMEDLGVFVKIENSGQYNVTKEFCKSAYEMHPVSSRGSYLIFNFNKSNKITIQDTYKKKELFSREYALAYGKFLIRDGNQYEVLFERPTLYEDYGNRLHIVVENLQLNEFENPCALGEEYGLELQQRED